MERWERFPGESAQAYQAAKCYFELGAERSLAAVSQTCGKSVSLLARWSARWSWPDRAAASARHMARLEQLAREQAMVEEGRRWVKRRAQQREREWAAAEALLRRAEQMIGHPLTVTVEDEGRTVIQPAKWSLRDVATYYEAASKLARRAADMDTYDQKVEAGINRELDAFLDELEAKLPWEVYLQVLEIYAPDDEQTRSRGTAQDRRSTD